MRKREAEDLVNDLVAPALAAGGKGRPGFGCYLMLAATTGARRGALGDRLDCRLTLGR